MGVVFAPPIELCSLPLMCVTESSAPQNFRNTTFDVTSVELRWGVPVEPNGVISVYEVRGGGMERGRERGGGEWEGERRE